MPQIRAWFQIIDRSAISRLAWVLAFRDDTARVLAHVLGLI